MRKMSKVKELLKENGGNANVERGRMARRNADT